MAVLQQYVFTNVPTATGQSDELNCGFLSNKTVFLSGGVFTAAIQVSVDGTNWANAVTAIMVASNVIATNVPETAAFMRIDITAYTSGTPAASLLAHSSVDSN